MRLRTVLAPVVPLYDYIFIDCAPSLDLLTVNALCAADTVAVSYTHLALRQARSKPKGRKRNCRRMIYRSRDAS